MTDEEVIPMVGDWLTAAWKKHQSLAATKRTYGSLNCRFTLKAAVTVRDSTGEKWHFPAGAEVCMFGQFTRIRRGTAATVFERNRQVSVMARGVILDKTPRRSQDSPTPTRNLIVPTMIQPH